MAIEYSFVDNESYGAGDINKTISLFVTGGVAEADRLADGSFNTSDKNKIAQAYAINGGVLSDTRTTLKVIRINTNTVTVLQGSAFFENGSSITLTSSENLTFIAGSVNYVYLYTNMALNKNELLCTTTQKADMGNVVPLATINADGSVTDNRVYVRGKIEGYASVQNQPHLITVTCPAYNHYSDPPANEGIVTVDMGGNVYNYIILMDSTNCWGWYDIQNDDYHGVFEWGDSSKDFTKYGGMYTKGNPSSGTYERLKFAINGTSLTCTFSGFGSDGTEQHKLYLC